MMRPIACLLSMLSVAVLVCAEDPGPETAVLYDFLAGWNAEDPDAIAKALNFPVLTIVPGQGMVIAENVEAFAPDFDRLRAEDGWEASSFDPYDAITPVHEDEQIHISTVYRRYDGTGRQYHLGGIYYILTEVDGHWGVQVRMPKSRETLDENAKAEAIRTVGDFFDDWNAADNDRLAEHIHIPHAFVLPGGAVRVADSYEAAATDFERLRRDEGWGSSTIEWLDCVHAEPNAAVAHLIFARRDPEGEIYRQVYAIWFLNKIDGRWGVQVRSILPSIVAD